MVFLESALGRLSTIALVVVSLTTSVHAAQTTLENDVKAAFLFNFTKFIDWPPSALSGDSFRLCVVADPAFTASVDSTIAEESVGGRRLVRIDPQSADDARSCAMLYVGRAHGDRGARLLAAVRDSPVLTVGEGSDFLKQGGAIGFVLENNRVRFDISTQAIQKSRLKASSKLLHVARTVDPGSPK